jgi:monoamine oxidase
MTAALELRRAGYKVQVLEFNDRPGGRNWTIRGGDTYTELGGEKQACEFGKGLYFNAGPWRIPYHHHAVIDYCRRLGVALEPFVQLNHNAYLHSSTAFGGKPRRLREIGADFQGHVADLLAKATQQGKLDESVSSEDREILLQALRSWGALDANYTYKAGLASVDMRGYAKDAGGGLNSEPVPGAPVALSNILKSGLWRNLRDFSRYEHQATMFQAVGGMDMIGKGFARQIGDLIRYNSKVTRIQQDDRGVTVTYQDTKAGAAAVQLAKADWCVCAIPLHLLAQIPLAVGAPMKAAVDAIPYGASVKVALQFKRRFWEEDDGIYGGVSWTDGPIRLISYPSNDLARKGRGILLGAYLFGGPNSFAYSAMSSVQRIETALQFGARVHPQYRAEYENGISVAWHRVPFSMGCSGLWTDAKRKQHYNNLCAIDGRIVLAGEHASWLPAWQEGAILSALDAITRLHERIVKS